MEYFEGGANHFHTGPVLAAKERDSSSRRLGSLTSKAAEQPGNKSSDVPSGKHPIESRKNVRLSTNANQDKELSKIANKADPPHLLKLANLRDVVVSIAISQHFNSQTQVSEYLSYYYPCSCNGGFGSGKPDKLDSQKYEEYDSDLTDCDFEKPDMCR